MIVKIMVSVFVMAITLLAITNAYVDKNMNKEEWHKMMSQSKCNITRNKTEEAIYVSQCCEEMYGIKINHPEDRKEYAQYNLTIDDWKEIHACRRKKSGKEDSEDGEWTKEKAVEMINNKLEFDNDETKKKLQKVYDDCDTVGSGNETATKECGKNGFVKVCFPNVTTTSTNEQISKK